MLWGFIAWWSNDRDVKLILFTSSVESRPVSTARTILLQENKASYLTVGPSLCPNNDQIKLIMIFCRYLAALQWIRLWIIKLLSFSLSLQSPDCLYGVRNACITCLRIYLHFLSGSMNVFKFHPTRELTWRNVQCWNTHIEEGLLLRYLQKLIYAWKEHNSL
jgi:hypothetical protein